MEVWSQVLQALLWPESCRTVGRQYEDVPHTCDRELGTQENPWQLLEKVWLASLGCLALSNLVRLLCRLLRGSGRRGILKFDGAAQNHCGSARFWCVAESLYLSFFCSSQRWAPRDAVVMKKEELLNCCFAMEKTEGETPALWFLPCCLSPCRHASQVLSVLY